MMYRKILFIFVGILLCFGFASNAHAAKLYLVGEGNYFGIGQEFYVDIKMNTEDVNINASEVKLLFPNGILELESVEQKPSVFDFWLAGPDFSNEKGEMTFTGGTPNGVSGSALQILRMKFKAVGAGSAQLAFIDSVVTASDGKGTNVLSSIEGVNINIGVTTLFPKSAPLPTTPSAPVSTEPVQQPEKIVRTPVPTGKLPEEPKLKASLYPDETKWYNHLGDLIVLWEVPDDIIQVATLLDHNPNGDPKDTEKDLTDGKNFGQLEEGIWYVHVQFKNDVGWSKVSNYKISLDMTPPLPFTIHIDNAASDNPIPTIEFNTNDSLSGIASFSLFVDGKGPTTIDSGSVTLPIQLPGEHKLKIRALDLAGNSTEDSLGFEILPLPTPTIDFITKTIAQGELIFVSGKSIPSSFVNVLVSNKSDQEVFSGQAKTDPLGNWELSIGQPLTTGKYNLTAIARDDRGATSYPTPAEEIRIKAKTIISIGLIDLGWFEISLISVLLAVLVVAILLWRSVLIHNKRMAYEAVAIRDVDKLCKLLDDDLNKLKNLILNPQDVSAPQAEANAETFLKKMQETVDKMKKYLAQEIGKIR